MQLVSKGQKSVASSSVPKRAKRRRTRNRKSQRSSAQIGRTVVGKDIIASFSSDSSHLTDGFPLAKIAVSPRAFAKSRLASESTLWNQWRPRKLRLTVRSTIPLLGNGLLIVAWSSQPNEVMGGQSLAPTRLNTMRPSTMVPMGSAAIIDIPVNNTRMPWYLCSGNNDLTDHGTVLACVGGAVTNVTGKIGFIVELEYDIEFGSPDITPQAEVDTIYVDEGWYPYFTTSDGSFADGKKLTLKRHEGGDPCQFSDAIPGVVYKLDPKATLPYYSSATDEGKDGILFMVRIKDSALPHVCLFVDPEKAKNYARTGDIAFCLDYFKQGDWVKPEDPYWMATESPASFSLGYGNPRGIVSPHQNATGKISDVVGDLADAMGFHRISGTSELG